MRRSELAPFAALALAGALLGCQPVEDEATKPEAQAGEDAKAEADAADATKKEAGVEARPADPAAQPVETPPEPIANGTTREGEPPKWYDESLYADSKVVRKDRSETMLSGGYASAMVLELAEGTSTQQCMAQALAEIAKEMGKDPTQLDAPEGNGDRLMAKGTGSGYEYVVVCGEAKGKQTMYLSYTRS